MALAGGPSDADGTPCLLPQAAIRASEALPPRFPPLLSKRDSRTGRRLFTLIRARNCGRCGSGHARSRLSHVLNPAPAGVVRRGGPGWGDAKVFRFGHRVGAGTGVATSRH
jgi:hypothetical protein